MNPEVLRSAAIGVAASIRDVRLRSVTARLPASDDLTPITIDLGVRVDRATVSAETVSYSIEFRVSGNDGEALHIFGTFDVIYNIPGEAQGTQDDLDAFGNVSVMFSVHPYIRELVQSLTVRAGLPPLVLDTLRAPLDDVDENEVSRALEALPAAEARGASPPPVPKANKPVQRRSSVPRANAPRQKAR